MTMTTASNRKRAAVALVFLGAVANLSELSSFLPSSTGSRHFRRLSLRPEGPRPAIYPWARERLRPLGSAPAPATTALFWHIPKSGGTPLQFLFECMGQTLANQVGVHPRYGHQDKEELVVFKPFPLISRASYVNVDTTSRRGIHRAKKLGLVPSGLADILVTTDPKYALENLFDSSHKGRMFALFRHPVDRLVSKFYYLQTATWESQYRPQWQNMTIMEFARKRNTDNNYLVKRLAGLGSNATATREHLQAAMRTIRQRFVVGLTERMEESVHRFNLALGIDEAEETNSRCLEHFFQASVGAKRHNSDARKKVDPGSPAWKALARTNDLDLRLYDYLLEVFLEQRDIIESYASASAYQEDWEQATSTS